MFDAYDTAELARMLDTEPENAPAIRAELARREERTRGEHMTVSWARAMFDLVQRGGVRR